MCKELSAWPLLHEKGDIANVYILLNEIISHRIIAALEKLVLSFLEQLGTNTIEVELVNRMKTKQDGYQSPFRTSHVSTTLLLLQLRCSSCAQLAEKGKKR